MEGTLAEGTTMEGVAVAFEKLDLAAGDVLVMRFQYHLEPEIVQELTKKLYEALPAGVRCIVTDPSIDISVHHPAAE